MKVTLTWGANEKILQFPDQQALTVGQALLSLGPTQPQVVKQWCDGQGRLKTSLPAFVNDTHVRYLNGWETVLQDGDRLHVIPVVTGG